MYYKKPISVERSNIFNIHGNLFGVTCKCDGELVFINNVKNTLQITDINKKVVKSYPSKEFFSYTIYAEFTDGVFYVFDCSLNLPFSKRYNIIKFLKIYNINIKLNRAVFTKNPFNVTFKNIPFESDGIIYTPENILNPIYKWKPFSKLTADFIIINQKCHCLISVEQYSKLPFLDKVKFEINYFPILFQTEDNLFAYKFEGDESFNNFVVECIYQNNSWNPIKIRKDKTIQYNNTGHGPNNWKTVYSIYQQALDYLSLEKIREIIKNNTING